MYSATSRQSANSLRLPCNLCSMTNFTLILDRSQSALRKCPSWPFFLQTLTLLKKWNLAGTSRREFDSDLGHLSVFLSCQVRRFALNRAIQ